MKQLYKTEQLERFFKYYNNNSILIERAKENIKSGNRDISDYIFLEDENGRIIAATVMNSKANGVIIPKINKTASDEQYLEIFKYLISNGGRRIILKDSLCDFREFITRSLPIIMIEKDMFYETSLINMPCCEISNIKELNLSDHKDLMEKLAVSSDILEELEDEGVRGWVIDDSDGSDAGIGLLRTSNPHAVSIEIVGILSEKRNKGLGQQLHRALLEKARATHQKHIGTTPAWNEHMHKILLKNGGVLTETQYVLDVKTPA